MRLAALGALQSVLLSLRRGTPSVIDAETWGLDAMFVLSRNGGSRFPLASSLLLADAYAAPVALLAALGADQNATTVTQTLALDVVPQLVRHECPDLPTSLATAACVRAVAAEQTSTSLAFSAAAVALCQLSSAPHHEAFALLYAAVGLYRYSRLLCVVAAAVLVGCNRFALLEAARSASSAALLATEPMHSATLRALPDVLDAVRDYPPEVKGVVLSAVSDAIEAGDRAGSAILRAYVALMQSTPRP